MRNAVSYDKDQRARAKQENLRLMCIQITGKGGKGGITMSGPCSEEFANKVQDLLAEAIVTSRGLKTKD